MHQGTQQRSEKGVYGVVYYEIIGQARVSCRGVVGKRYRSIALGYRSRQPPDPLAILSSVVIYGARGSKGSLTHGMPPANSFPLTLSWQGACCCRTGVRFSPRNSLRSCSLYARGEREGCDQGSRLLAFSLCHKNLLLLSRARASRKTLLEGLLTAQIFMGWWVLPGDGYNPALAERR